jgi:hypothetical protein
LQSIIGLMLRYKDRTFARCVVKSTVVASIRNKSFIVEKLQTKQTDSYGIISDAYLYYNMI